MRMEIRKCNGILKVETWGFGSDETVTVHPYDFQKGGMQQIVTVTFGKPQCANHINTTVSGSTAASKESCAAPATEQSRTASPQLEGHSFSSGLAGGGGCLLLLLVGIGGAASAAYILLPKAVTALQTLL